MSIKRGQGPAEETDIPGGWAEYKYSYGGTVIWHQLGFRAASVPTNGKINE